MMKDYEPEVPNAVSYPHPQVSKKRQDLISQKRMPPTARVANRDSFETTMDIV